MPRLFLFVVVVCALCLCSSGAFTELSHPVQLVRPTPNHMSFEIVPENFELLKTLDCPVAVFSIVGPIRTGKSSFLNRLVVSLGGPTGMFSASSFSEPHTQGLWVWVGPKIVRNGLEFRILFIDSEGFSSYESDREYESKLFSVIKSISSYIDYNVMHSMNDELIEQLNVLAFDSNLVSSDASFELESSKRASLALYPPQFSLVVQSFTQVFQNNDTCSTQLRKKLQSHHLGRQRSEVFTSESSRLLGTFQNVSCFTLSPPTSELTALRTLDAAPEKELTAHYVSDFNLLREDILSRTLPKTFEGKYATGSDIASLLSSFVLRVNSISLPTDPGPWKYRDEQFATGYMNDAMQVYRSYMERSLLQPASLTEFLEFHEEGVNLAKKTIEALWPNKPLTTQVPLQGLESKILEEEKKFRVTNKENADSFLSSLSKEGELAFMTAALYIKYPLPEADLEQRLDTITNNVSNEYKKNCLRFLLSDACEERLRSFSLQLDRPRYVKENQNSISSLIRTQKDHAMTKFQTDLDAILVPLNPTSLSKRLQVVESSVIDVFVNGTSPIGSSETFLTTLESLKHHFKDLNSEKIALNEKHIGEGVDNEVDRSLRTLYTASWTAEVDSRPATSALLESRYKATFEKMKQQFFDQLKEYSGSQALENGWKKIEQNLTSSFSSVKSENSKKVCAFIESKASDLLLEANKKFKARIPQFPVEEETFDLASNEIQNEAKSFFDLQTDLYSAESCYNDQKKIFFSNLEVSMGKFSKENYKAKDKLYTVFDVAFAEYKSSMETFGAQPITCAEFERQHDASINAAWIKLSSLKKFENESRYQLLVKNLEGLISQTYQTSLSPVLHQLGAETDLIRKRIMINFKRVLDNFGVDKFPRHYATLQQKFNLETTQALKDFDVSVSNYRSSSPKFSCTKMFDVIESQKKTLIQNLENEKRVAAESNANALRRITAQSRKDALRAIEWNKGPSLMEAFDTWLEREFWHNMVEQFKQDSDVQIMIENEGMTNDEILQTVLSSVTIGSIDDHYTDPESKEVIQTKRSEHQRRQFFVISISIIVVVFSSIFFIMIKRTS